MFLFSYAYSYASKNQPLKNIMLIVYVHLYCIQYMYTQYAYMPFLVHMCVCELPRNTKSCKSNHIQAW